VFSLLFVGQLQQVLEAELAFDVLEVIPAPLRYHRGLTPPRAPGKAGTGPRVRLAGGGRCWRLEAS
jgi:hypothetical protein